MMINQKEKNKSSLNDGLIISIGVLTSLLFVWFLLRIIDLNIVWSSIQKLSIFTILGSLIAIALSSIFRSKAWQEILNNRISFKRSFKSVNEGQMLNTILPLRMGDLARAFITTNSTDLKIWELIATILIERIFDIFIMLILLILTLPFVIAKSLFLKSLIVAVFIIIFAIILIIIIIVWPNKLKNSWNKIFGKFKKINNWGKNKIDEVSKSLQILRDFKKFIKILFWMVSTWAFALLSLWIVLVGFFSDPEWSMLLFLQGISGLGVSIPSSPGNIGVYEATMVFGLSTFNIEESVAFAFGVLHHLISILPIIIFGLVSLFLDGQNLKELFSKLRNIRKG